MVNDQEPRYRLVDSNGNVVGSLFQNADGNVEIQDETGTGSVFGPNGIVTPAIDAGSVSTEKQNIGQVVARVWNDDADQTIPDSTATQIEWTDSDGSLDTSDIVDVDLDNDEVTILESGKYTIRVKIHWRDSANWSEGDRAALTIDGDLDREDNRQPAHGGWTDQIIRQMVFATQNLTQGDTVRAECEQQSGDNVDLVASDRFNELTVVRHG